MPIFRALACPGAPRPIWQACPPSTARRPLPCPMTRSTCICVAPSAPTFRPSGTRSCGTAAAGGATKRTRCWDGRCANAASPCGGPPAPCTATSGVRRPRATTFALIVTLPEGEYLADLGVADFLREPLPLREGDYEQDGMHFRLRRLDDGWWRVHNDPAAQPDDFDFHPGPADEALIARQHVFLSDDPASPFILTFERSGCAPAAATRGGPGAGNARRRHRAQSPDRGCGRTGAGAARRDRSGHTRRQRSLAAHRSNAMRTSSAPRMRQCDRV